MRILISGAGGFTGSALGPFLASKGHAVARLVRRIRSSGDILWNPDDSILDPKSLEGFEVVIHLSGANIASRRWTPSFKRLMWDSRIRSTELLVSRLSSLPRPPKVFLCASATGYYGDRGDEQLTETSPAGSGFLSQLCVQWEQVSKPLESRGTRVVNLRSGMILSADGGALKKMLLPFRLGLGGRFGSGNQYWSWITLDDWTSAVDFILTRDTISGPVNMTSPNPVTNREFVLTLASALHRPALFPVPEFALRAVFGEMAGPLFLASQRTLPRKLIDNQFHFGSPSLASALAPLRS